MGLSQYLEGHSNPDLPETLRFPATYLSFWRKKIGLWVVHFAGMSLVASTASKIAVRLSNFPFPPKAVLELTAW